MPSVIPHGLQCSLTLAVVALVGACTDSVASPEPPQPSEPRFAQEAARENSAVCDADNGGLTLPANFCAAVIARDVGIARHIVVRPNGDIYVALDNSRDGTITGAILALRDADGDGTYETQQRFGPTGGNGIAYQNEQLWFAPNDRILRYTFSGNELVPSGGPDIIAANLPADGDHVSKTLVLDGTGGMFVNFGSASNSCQVEDRTDFSPGVDPCPEFPIRSGIWRLSSSATGQTPSVATRFVTETRNMVALAINPADHLLYGAQNGRDQLFDNWPNLFDAQDDALLPAEELFRFEQGKAYGWPYCYYDEKQHRKVLAPEYGGDGSIVGRCDSREDPIAVYPAHWAPLSMLFYTGTQFPKRYQGGLFIAFHGSRFDPTQQPAGPGYVVTFTKWEANRPHRNYETFADGFAGAVATPTDADHRPVGLAQAPDGSLIVGDDKAGWIWRIVHTKPEK